MAWKLRIQVPGTSWGGKCLTKGKPFPVLLQFTLPVIGGTFGLSRVLGYTGNCLSSPLAWAGATSLLIPVYVSEIRHHAMKENR